jgi:hypothetical protein
MNKRTLAQRKHLRIEEMDTLALKGGRRLRERDLAHLAACERCRSDVEELRVLHAALAALAPLQPLAGFADRVMQRVQLPIAWRVRALEAARAHWIATAGAVAGFVAVVVAGGTLLSRYPELTPVTVAGFLLQRGTELAWGVMMDAGRFLYGTGLVSLAQGLAEQMAPVTAFAALATVLVVGLGALRVMLSLMNTPSESRATMGR